MLKITIPASEQFDENTNEFISIKEQTVELEHSLVSLSKWESKWCKPFLSKADLTLEENVDYIRCMSLTKNIDPSIFYHLTKENIKKIQDYISAPMTATTIREINNGRPNREQLTSELIYYYMIALNIPFECEKWHLNRLITLIRVCSIKSDSPKKMSRKDILNQNAALNAARRAKSGSRG